MHTVRANDKKPPIFGQGLKFLKETGGSQGLESLRNHAKSFKHKAEKWNRRLQRDGSCFHCSFPSYGERECVIFSIAFPYKELVVVPP